MNQDIFNIASKVTPARLVNGLKLLSSYHLSRVLKRDLQWGMPISLSVEPTTSCNLRCPECPSGLRAFTRPTGMMSMDTFTRIIDEQHRRLLYLILYFQGEPYLNKQFFDMIRYAHEKKIYTATSTNAHYLNKENAFKTVESGLDRLIISIDGTTQEAYQNYRVGGTLQKVIEGTKQVIEWKRRLKSKTPHIIFQFLVVRQNEHQVEEVKKLAHSLGVDSVALKTAQVYDYENGSSLLPENEKYSRYQKMSNGKYAIKNRLLNQCWKMWHSSVITWDGRVAPCCFDKDVQHPMGALNGATFRDIWYGSNYRNFRKALLKSRREIDICKNCTEGTKVWA